MTDADDNGHEDEWEEGEKFLADLLSAADRQTIRNSIARVRAEGNRMAVVLGGEQMLRILDLLDHADRLRARGKQLHVILMGLIEAGHERCRPQDCAVAQVREFVRSDPSGDFA